MPTYQDIARGYYDPNLGTYVTPGRVDWRATLEAGNPGVFPASMPPQYASDPGYARDATGQGSYPVNFAPYNWMQAAMNAGLPYPTDRQLVLNPNAPPGASVSDRVNASFGLNGGGAGTGTPMTAEEQYRQGERDLQYIAPAGTPLGNDWSTQPPQSAGPLGVPADRVGALDPRRWNQGAGAGSGQQQPEQSNWRKWPKNAAYVSTDGLVAYDEQGYRLDGVGNRALGPESDEGAHLFNQGYDTASAGWNQAHGWA